MFKIDGKNVFICDDNEFSGVKKIADKVCLDVERVTGTKPNTVFEPAESRSQSDLTEFAGANSPQIFFATLNKTPLAEKLAADNGLTDELS